ncbi:MAG: MCE family protein [Rhodothermia bacterium]|nr:MCE family protein [Rhodothermia bacterium]
MRFANELKVGLAIVVTVAIFVFGIRYLKDIPLFSGTSGYYAVVDDAGGLIAGNPVRVSGVKVGSVTDVVYEQEIDSIRVRFKVDQSIKVPFGTTAEVAGIDALGGVRIDLSLGHRGNPAIPPGGRVDNAPDGADILAEVSRRAPELANKADSVLTNLDATLSATSELLGNPSSDLRRTIGALRGTASALETTIREESAHLGGILENLESISGSFKHAMDEQGDSLSYAVADMRSSMQSLDELMQSLKTTTARLDAVAAKIEAGDGTLGKLINDDGLYVHLDSAVVSLNQVLVDFKKHPRRYLRELKIVDIL